MFHWHRAVPSHLFTRPCWQVEQYLPMIRRWNIVHWTATKEAAIEIATIMNREKMENKW